MASATDGTGPTNSSGATPDEMDGAMLEGGGPPEQTPSEPSDTPGPAPA